MAYTQADIDALKKAAARGATRLRLGDEEVQFASLSDLRRQIGIMEAELAGQKPGGLAFSTPRTLRGL